MKSTLLPEMLDDYVIEENPVRVVDVFVDNLDLKSLGFEGVTPAVTGRPSYPPAIMLKLYVYGYHQILDGQSTLLNQNTQARCNGNELACAFL